MPFPAKRGLLLLFAAPSLIGRLRRWGGIGLLLLGVVDSSIIPTLGSLDLLTAVLAVRHRDLWFYYAAMSTAGSLLGAFITYRMGLRAGSGWLERRIGASGVQRFHAALQHWGFGAVFVAVLAPPPFPTSPFLLAAGALHYRVSRFLAAVFSGRAIRYSAIAYIAARLSRQIIRVLRHPQQYVWMSVAVTVILIVGTVTAVLLLRVERHPAEPTQDQPHDIPDPSAAHRAQ
ncbi:MAG: YqaA family protein [Terriglobales bacterium]